MSDYIVPGSDEEKALFGVVAPQGTNTLAPTGDSQPTHIVPGSDEEKAMFGDNPITTVDKSGSPPPPKPSIYSKDDLPMTIEGYGDLTPEELHDATQEELQVQT